MLEVVGDLRRPPAKLENPDDGGRDWFPFFNARRDQEITNEEVAMSFLRLFARGAQVTVPP